jgi:hypothetical protein
MRLRIWSRRLVAETIPEPMRQSLETIASRHDRLSGIPVIAILDDENSKPGNA